MSNKYTMFFYDYYQDGEEATHVVTTRRICPCQEETSRVAKARLYKPFPINTPNISCKLHEFLPSSIASTLDKVERTHRPPPEKQLCFRSGTTMKQEFKTHTYLVTLILCKQSPTYLKVGHLKPEA